MRHAALAAVMIACVPLSACAEKSTGIAAVSRPWEQPLAIDRFVANATQIVITTTTGTGARLTSVVPAASLPDPLFILTVDVFVPTDVGYSLLLDGISIVVRREDGTATANVLSETASRLIGATTIGTQRYSVFRLVGNLTTVGPMSPATFASVAFGFRLSYEDPTGDEVHAQQVLVEVQKQ
jgi:hypothetical protein